MVFGYINSKDWSLNNDQSQRINIGEYIQFRAMKLALQGMGIPDDRIIPLDIRDVESYDGEEMILVLTNASNLSRIPDNIRPVYIGYNNWGYDIDSREEIDLLNSLDTVGCRDAVTSQYLAERGISSYINGCISITLPRKNEPLGDKVYIVDVPSEIMNYIPEELADHARFRTHEYYFEEKQSEEALQAFSEKQYREYYDDAKLVVTSRLHLAAPCIAWGIPVVLIRQNPFLTFSWIDKYIPIYTPDMYDHIDWNPRPLNIEIEKKTILRDITYRVFAEYYKDGREYDTHVMYSDRPFIPKTGYYRAIIEGLTAKIRSAIPTDAAFKYVIWGITNNAELLYEYMCENYPDAVLSDAVDRYKRISFHGLNISVPDEVDYRDKWVFVIPTGAVQEARQLLENTECSGYIFATETFLTEGELRDHRRER